MPRVPIIRRAMVALSSTLLVAAVLMPLAGIASASSSSTTCPSGEGTECYLVIAAPSSVRTGFAFTVQVLVTTDGTTIAKSDPCGSKAPITLSLSGDAYTAYQTVNASAGIATFTFTIPAGPGNAGSYSLFASGPGDEAAPATTCGSYFYVTDETALMAVDIPLGAPIAPCPPDTNCVQATSGSGTQATLIADPGSGFWTSLFTASYFGGAIPTGNCGAGGPIDSNGVLGFFLTGTTQTKVIILALNTVSKGIGLFNVCWNGGGSFFTNNTGAQVQTGDLPNCRGRDRVPPCVLSRTSGQHNVGILSILAPGNDPNDPFAYAH